MLTIRRLRPAAALLLTAALAFFAPEAGGLRGAAGQEAAGPPGAQPQADTGAVLDETALRHYARTRDLERLEAEIRRLRALDPSWQPPDDLFSPEVRFGGFDETPIWELFAAGRHAEARERIAETERSLPGYRPSQDLLNQLDLAEAEERLRAAASAQQWSRVIEIAREQPALTSCERVDNTWVVAEAYGRGERWDEAEQLYRGILTLCSDEAVLIATLQKANDLLDGTRVARLDAVLAARAGGSEQVGQARDALRRGQLAERLSGKEPLEPALLAQLESEARAGRDAELATNLGWYHAERRQWQQAAGWFEQAQEWGAGASAIEGRVLALMRQGRHDAAQSLAARHAGASPAIYRTYIGLLTERLGGNGRTVDLEVAGRLAQHAERHRDHRTALALGWAAQELGDLHAAESWFRQSLSWRESEDAAIGLAVTLQRRGDQAGFQELLAAWSGRSERIRRMAATGGGASSAATRALERDELSSCLELTSGAELSTGDREIRAWCLFRAGRNAEASQLFERLMAAAPNQESYAQAAFGHLLAMVQRGLLEEAMFQMQALPLTPVQKTEVFAQVLEGTAITAYDNQDFALTLRMIEAYARIAPLPTHLATMQGWAYYNTHQLERAKAVFQSLDRQLSTQDTRHALEVLRERELK